MDKKTRILAINPGSTTTKMALYDNNNELFGISVTHSLEDLKPFTDIQDQLQYRTDLLEKIMLEKGYHLEDVDVFVGRGGGLVPMEGGVYAVSELLADHASRAMSGAAHPAQLAAQIARQFADRFGKQAYVVNPPDVDEFQDIARVTGVRGIYRESHIHALNQKEVAVRFCNSRGAKYEDMNLIICHLGGGISITAHEKGKMIDSNDIINGAGPMTPTRSGDLPYMKIIELSYSGEYTKKELTDKLNQAGGLISHFGTTDVPEILEKVADGDKYAELIINGMIYQCAKYAGAMAVALKGKIDAIIITGGIADNTYFTDRMKDYLAWIAEIVVMPHEFELEALAAGVMRVINGEEAAKTYTGIPVWSMDH
ncbi:MAG: butyrate kinase [Oscillospiraceae bacterium]|nr:butyrate kinase [Oscillospiraceae bacterium]